MSLKNCISKAGDHLDPTIKKQLLARADELRGEGLSELTAADAAIDEQIAAVRSQLDSDASKSAPRQTDTPEFKKWFGDSQAVMAVNAETGEPVVSSAEPKRVVPRTMYHTTRNSFAEFEVGRTSTNSGTFGDWEVRRSGIFFTPDLAQSESYGKSGGRFVAGANVMPVYLRAANPLDLTDGLKEGAAEALAATGHVSARFLYNNVPSWENFDDETGEAFAAAVKAAGYDSVIFNETDPDSDETFETWVVFEPEQIKSAIGNRGTFDGNNADITKSAARTDTPEFKKWFGDSKVVDAEGKPLVVYHGSASDIKEFRAPAYFTDFDEEADDYSGATYGVPGATTYPVYLSLQNPKFLGDVWNSRSDELTNRKITQLVKQGYDGAAARDGNSGAVHWIAFRSDQIKSAIGNDGSFDPKNKNITKSAGRIWYSQLQQALAQAPAKFDGAAAPMWAQWLKANAAKLGVRQEEITWSGIEDYLKLRGKDKLSREELAAWVGANGVKVEEVVLGDEVLPDGWIARQDEDGDWVVVDDEGDVRGGTAATRSGAIADAQIPGGRVRKTKYGQYTLPGGENYREVLLTLPEKSGTVGAKFQAREVAGGGAEVYDRDTGRMVERATTLRQAVDRATDYNRVNPNTPLADKNYRSSHWSQPNVLAHVRLNDRTDADGKRVLFVEELQSDWGQDGRKKGFAGGDVDTERRALLREANEATPYPTAERMAQIQARLAELASGSNSPTTVPAAPFVTKTEDWLNLALKRVIKLAVDGGYDKVAFVTGEQSAERYDLSKQISRITLTDGTGLGMGRDTPVALSAYDLQGARTISRLVRSEQEIEDLVGKEVASRLLSAKPKITKEIVGQSEQRELVGLDLKVGGEGMKTFYDAIVPNAVKGLLKKLGGEGLATVDLGSYREQDIDENDGGRMIDVKHDFGAQPGFAITDKMRERAADGMPLFSAYRSDPALEAWADDALSGRKGERFHAVASSLPHPAWLMAGLDSRRPVTVDLRLVSHLRTHDHPEITPAIIGRLAALMARPRAMIRNEAVDDNGRTVQRYQALVDARDEHGRPILVAVRPSQEGVRGHAIDVYDVRTMFGRQESMQYMIDQLRMGNVVWMADEEVTALQEFMGRATIAHYPPKRSSRPSSAATTAIVPGDAAAANFPAKGWKQNGNKITIPPDAWRRAQGVAFSRSRATDTPEFKAWFGESKVVDADGKPLVVYHGTDAAEDFPEFKPGRGMERFHFGSADQANARIGASREVMRDVVRRGDIEPHQANRRLLPVYLSLKNPLRMPDLDDWVDKTNWLSALPKLPQEIRGAVRNHAEGPAHTPFFERMVLLLKGRGYDGIVYRNEHEAKDKPSDSWIAFDPEQIKSAIGNDGSFDPKSKDITKSAARVTETPEFKAWFGKSKVVGVDGEPLVMYHGSTHDFTAFKPRKANPGNDFGRGIYATSSAEDASTNYAGEGPDLTNRIETRAEQIASDKGWEYDDPRAVELARRELAGGAANVMPLYVRIENPLMLGGDDPTWMDERAAGKFARAVAKSVRQFAIDTRGSDARPDRETEMQLDDLLEAAMDGADAKVLIAKARNAAAEVEDLRSGDLIGPEVVRKAIQHAGYDGIIDHTVSAKWGADSDRRNPMAGVDWDTVHVIAFRADQVKSATGNRGSFDAADPDITKSGMRAFDAPEPSRFDNVVYAMSDKHVDTKRVVEAVKKTQGEIRDDLDVYLQEELFHGRAAKRTEDFVHHELQPLVEQMRDAGLSVADLDEFLHARHAREANAVIAQRNPEIQDGGSGMLNQDAAAYFAELPADKRRQLEAAAAQVDAMLAATRKLMVDYELESTAKVQGWAEMFEHYVPLMREDDGGHSGNGTGQGYSIRGKEVKSRTGSTRKVVDILANIALQRERTIVRGEKNRVSRALFGLAAANPNADFWTVDTQIPSEPVYNPATGLVEDRPDTMYKMRPNVITTKIADEQGNVSERAVVFNEKDERAMRMSAALKNLDAAQLEGLLGASAKLTRYFASVNTQFNPVFGVVNLVRDVQGALVNLGTTEIAGKQKDVARQTLSALRGIYGDLRATRKGGTASSRWAQLWEEFQQVGGQTGYRQLFATSNDRADAIKSAIDPHAWMDSKLGKIFTAGGALKVPLASAQRGAKWIFDWLSDYNSAMENGVRLAAYKTALDAGLSKERAASLAKNLTVNFNRKGQVAQQAGALYAFFNASMQGTARMGQVLVEMEPGKPKTIRLSGLGKKVVYGGMLLGSVQALALAAAGFGDDDPPEWARERNLIIPTGGKTYVSIPLPLGLHVIPNIGRSTTAWALGGFKDTPKRVVGLFGSLADAFNPIGNAGLSIQTIAPTAIDPLVALTENKDWSGRPITRESSNKAVPGHALARDTASSVGKLLSEGINTLSGGTKYTAGVLSPSPEQIDYLIGQITGGVGRELSKVEQTALGAVRGETVPLYKVPLVGRLVGNAAGQSSEGSAFYANVDRLNEIETEIKGLKKDGKTAEANAVRMNNPQAYLITQASHAERQVQKLRREKSELIKAGAPREQVKAIEEKITARMAALNRAVEALKAD